MKCLIVTGDDFGISRGINRGIVEAHLSGIVTSTSLMVDRPACEEAVALAGRCPTLSLLGFRDLPTLAAPAEAIPAPGDAA